jgi:hypothetical protein
MRNDFSELWSRSEAVIALFVGWEVLSQNTNIEARISISVEEAFEGHSAKLDQDQFLSLYGKVRAVGRAIKGLAEKMVALELSGTYRMPAVLWMRLANETGFEIEADTIRRFGVWSIENGMAVLMMCKHHRNIADWDRPELIIDGGPVAFGYTPVELLLAKKTSNPHWPYHLKWQAVYTAQPSTVVVTVAPPLVNVAHRGKVADVSKPSPGRPQRKKLEPVNGLIKRYGKPVMVELEERLKRESTATDSLLTESKRKGGRYVCKYSLEHLVEALMTKHKTLERWSPSTLQRVMPAFVACPRGRPGWIAELAPKVSKPVKRR